MAVSFANIKPKVDRVFGFIEHDLRQMLTLNPGSNFAVAGLAACACETLARYRYGSGEGALVFSRLLPPGPLQEVAKTVYDVLRNGLVHRYNTADLRIDGKMVRLAISWRAESHLSIKSIDGVPNLVLNATTLCADLFVQFACYRRDLEQNPEMRDRFLVRYRETGIVEITAPKHIEAWKAIVGDALK